MQYPDKIYECITGGETYLVTHEEAIVLSQSMRLINQNPGWRIWNKLNTTRNGAIYQYLDAFILVDRFNSNQNYFNLIESSSHNYNKLMEVEYE